MSLDLFNKEYRTKHGGSVERTLNLNCLLRQGKLALQKCIEITKSNEVSNNQQKNMDQTTTEDVHKVETTRKKT